MDASLYQLVLGMEPALQTLSVSPATFQTTIAAFVDVLIEQHPSATLWVKLPPGETWQAEIERYHQQVAVPHTIYWCRGGADNSAEATSAPTQLSAVEEADSPMFPLQLIPKNPLRRDYFLLVLSPQFSGLLLAHRPQTGQGKKTPSAEENSDTKTSAVSDPTTQNGSISHLPSSTKKKTLLQVLFTFNQATVQQVLEGIRHSLAASHQSLANDSLITQHSQTPEEIASLVTQLLTKQVQRQDETFRRNAADQAASVAATALQRQNEALVDDLLFKNELLSNSLLELRTPLTSMKTALKLLESPQLKPPQRQRYMQLLHTQCDRQSSLIRGLMDLVQLDSAPLPNSLQPVQLADIVPSVVSTYQPLAQEKGLQLGYTIPSNLPAVVCLESWLRQIVINLLHNSIKFTPSGGQVVVKAKQQGDYIQLEFRDTGMGIAPNELPKIFDRFYRGRTASGEDTAGAGLGLTIVQQLLLRCGGSVSVTSKLTQGSTFKVLLSIHNATHS